MKEKKYLRLLSFRAQGGVSGRTRGAGRSEFFDERADAELSEMLRHWVAPDASRMAEGRLLAAYRAEVVAPRAPLWKRLLTASVPVPAPIAGLAAVALLFVSAALLMRPPIISLGAPHAALPPAEVTRIVEVPVAQEQRVVTRIVYVEKKKGQATDAASADERQRLAAGPERAPVRPGQRRKPEGTGTGYFTRVDMAEFQPADEMKIRIIKRGNGDEK